MTKQRAYERQERVDSQLRLGGSAARALRLLDTCPLLPVDAFAGLNGLSSIGGAYKQLAKLRTAGLADAQPADLGYLLYERPSRLWKITELGRRALAAAGVKRAGEPPNQSRTVPDRAHREDGPRGARLTVLVAAYRLLSAVAAERARDGAAVEVCEWESPWIRFFWSAERGRHLKVKLPGCARLCSRQIPGQGRSTPTANASNVLVLPDLGTAPVSHHREVLGRLVAFAVTIGDRLGEGEWELVIATVDPDDRGTRRDAWLRLVERTGMAHETAALKVRVLRWDNLCALTSGDQVHPPFESGADRDSVARAVGQGHVGRRAPAGGEYQALHLIGRHPFLTVQQLSDLLGTRAARIRLLEQDMVARGWLRPIQQEEIPRGSGVVDSGDWESLGLVEITQAGRLRLAAALGLDATTATRYHGFIGYGRGQSGRRVRLLRTLAHTLGANAVFVAFAVAADAARQVGSSDYLAQWRSAATCERRHCKPDGYGCYLRDGVAFGFFLEFDRGTESGRQYAAKFHAYYRYRDSGQAARDYDGFPTLLFVTTDPLAEHRIADQAHRVWFIRGTEPLPILITTTHRITNDPGGILGRIWRTPAQIAQVAGAEHQYWPLGGPPRILVGTRIEMPRSNRERPAGPACRGYDVQEIPSEGDELPWGSSQVGNSADAFAANAGQLRQQTRSCPIRASARGDRLPVERERGASL